MSRSFLKIAGITFLIFLVCIRFKRTIDKDTIKENKEKNIVIDIQPFEGVSKKQVEFIQQQLSKVYPHISVKKIIPLPRAAYYDPRKRYRADSLIRILKDNTEDGHITIGLTERDISHTKGEVKDYGIMGLGYLSGKSCVVSTFRLSKDSLYPQFLKLTLHELGHTQGLPHCKESACIMRDAGGKNHFNEQISFCRQCKRTLSDKNWQL